MNESDDESPGTGPLLQVVQSEDSALSVKVARGSLSAILRKIVVVPISLLLVPFTLHKIGVTGFGTWAILTTIISLVWIIDPGIGPAVTKYVAEHHDDVAELRRIVNASCAVCLVISGAASCLAWLFSRAIIGELFRGPTAPPIVQILSLWPLVLLCITVFLLTTPFLSVINGCQRMDLTNILVGGAELFSASATVVFLCIGWGIRGLLLAQLLTSLFILVGSIAIVRRLLPSITPNPFACRLGAVRKIVTFSLPLYAGYVMTTLQNQLERLYLARFIGIVPVGWYSIASQGAAKVKRIPDLLLGPVLAAASQLDAGQERKKLERLHFRAHKYLAVVAVPSALFAVITARQLMRIWVGKHLALVAACFAVLVIGNLFSQMGAPTYFIMVGRGVLRPTVYASLIAAALNIVLSLIFIQRWGFAGAALGTAIPMIVSTLYFLTACRSQFRVPLSRTIVEAYAKPLVCSLAAACVIPAISFHKMTLWRELLAEILAFGAIYLMGLVTTRFFDSFDFDTAATHVPFLLRYRTKSAQ
jgi:O-antigen/teichoic acid export membrane protein